MNERPTDRDSEGGEGGEPVAVGAGIVGVFVGLGVGAWFWGTDSRDHSAGDPFGR